MNIEKNLPLDAFEIYQGNEKILQLGLGLKLFLPRPFSKTQERVWDFWKKYIDFVGLDKFTWARLGGGNRSRPVNKSTFSTIDSWLTGKKSFGENCWIIISSGKFDEMGEYSFELEGLGVPNEDELDINVMTLSFPVSLLDMYGGVGFAEELIALIDGLPFCSGVGGYIFQRSPHKYNSTIPYIAALCKRFEGVEIVAGHKEKYWAAGGLVSVNWITLIGEQLLTRLGGRVEIKGSLESDFKLTELSAGLAIRAGDTPLLGDKHVTIDNLLLWRSLYKSLRPIITIKDTYSFQALGFDAHRTYDWLTRLDK